MLAGPDLPEPTPASGSGGVILPGLPIDDGLILGVFFALLFGFFKIYYSAIKKKRSV